MLILATGGVYLGGGIAPKIKSRLTSKTFLDAYLDKGRLSPLLAEIPLRIILRPWAGWRQITFVIRFPESKRARQIETR